MSTVLLRCVYYIPVCSPQFNIKHLFWSLDSELIKWLLPKHVGCLCWILDQSWCEVKNEPQSGSWLIFSNHTKKKNPHFWPNKKGENIIVAWDCRHITLHIKALKTTCRIKESTQGGCHSQHSGVEAKLRSSQSLKPRHPVTIWATDWEGRENTDAIVLWRISYMSCRYRIYTNYMIYSQLQENTESKQQDQPVKVEQIRARAMEGVSFRVIIDSHPFILPDRN